MIVEEKKFKEEKLTPWLLREGKYDGYYEK